MGGVCLSACWDTTPPWEQTPPPPRSDPPRSRHPPPPEQTPSRADTPRTRHPPGTRYTPWIRYTPGLSTPPRTKYTPQEADSGIRSTSGQYASYWNAFLFYLSLKTCPDEKPVELVQFFIFMQFSTKILPNNRFLPQIQGLAPPHLGYPGSATASMPNPLCLLLCPTSSY